MNKLFLITGASGAGKTTAVKNLEKEILKDVSYCYFDSIGIPSTEEMIQKYGSGEEWQRVTTEEWIQKIMEKYLSNTKTILDGQMRLSYIVDACKKLGLENYEIVLFDCADEVRDKRLISRGHPELASEDMKNWSRFLKNEAEKFNCKILDTTTLSEEECKNELLKILTA